MCSETIVVLNQMLVPSTWSISSCQPGRQIVAGQVNPTTDVEITKPLPGIGNRYKKLYLYLVSSQLASIPVIRGERKACRLRFHYEISGFVNCITNH